MTKKYFYISSLGVAAVLLFAGIAFADHSWGNYHWARTSNPFTLKLGDNVSPAWDTYLGTTSADWSASGVLDTAIVAGGTDPRKCRATNGRVEVCSAKYGRTNWLGLAQIWVSGSHITKAITKLNDTHFNTAKYNTPGWRNFVMCQEVGHAFGLDHQDEAFNNPNKGTCMDYTDNPARDDGAGNNLHPNAHDYDMLAQIYAHLDSVQDGGGPGKGKGNKFGVRGEIDLDNPSEWGRAIKKDGKGNVSLYARDLGNNEKLFTFVIWAN